MQPLRRYLEDAYSTFPDVDRTQADVAETTRALLHQSPYDAPS